MVACFRPVRTIPVRSKEDRPFARDIRAGSKQFRLMPSGKLDSTTAAREWLLQLTSHQAIRFLGQAR
jgi:hypothetical protein